MAADGRVLIAGCGALGSVFACLLGNAGHDVTLLGREWHLAAIRSRGLKMDGIWGECRARGFRLATNVGQLSGRYALIIIAAKAYDTARIVSELALSLAPGGIALSVQNGLGNIECLVETFGPSRALAASVLVGARIDRPGEVTVTVQATPIILGPRHPFSAELMRQCRDWIAAFQTAGIPCEPTDDILPHLWAKVFYNAPLNPLGALLQVHYGTLGEEPDLKAIMDSVIEEAFEVAARKNVKRLWNSADEYRKHFYRSLLPATYNHRSSMLQDLAHGKRTEIDAINGKIWRYGAETGFPTPFNETLTRLMWQREQTSALHAPLRHTASDQPL